MLPHFESRDAYRQRQQERELWLPAMRAICRRHRLDTGKLIRLSEGTNVVFAVGDQQIIKLYPPFWQREFRAERDVARHLWGKLSVRTPQVLASGDLEGYAYIVMERLPGRYLSEIWGTLGAAEQTALAVELGQLLAQIHALPSQRLSHLGEEWPEFVAARSAGCVERHRSQGVEQHWLAQIPAFLESAAPLYPEAFQPVLVSADIHHQHLLMDRVDGAWHLCGLFDFDDARPGFREYDLAASALFLLWGRPAALRAFLLAYGYAEEQLDEALGRRLMAYTLLHRYRELRWVMHDILGDPPCQTFEELAALIFSV